MTISLNAVLDFVALPWRPAITRKFQVGDHVERIGAFVPQYMKHGVITRVIPNEQGQDWFTQYEVKFGGKIIGTFYQTQLRLAEGADDGGS